MKSFERSFFFAHVAQSVEHLHGKQKVTSSILVVGFLVLV